MKVIDELAATPSTASMAAVVQAFRSSEVPDEMIADLAVCLARSGVILEHPGIENVADVPSTGGPSSLSTLLCPLQLTCMGAVVPKLGVPGRPAGGIDVLACIPGFRPTLHIDEVGRCLKECGYAHFLAGKDFAPLDAALFTFRQNNHAQDVAGLAIASLLSKKLAVGVKKVALDVRVASFANFGSSWQEAKRNATAFVRVASLLGISASCVLTDLTTPYQGYIGRGESLLALKEIFENRADGDLLSHQDLCGSLASACLGRQCEASSKELAKAFALHLVQQGSNSALFEDKIFMLLAQPTYEIVAQEAGYCVLDLEGVRRILTGVQSGDQANQPFPDPAGLRMMVSSNDYVRKGETVGLVRTERALEDLTSQLAGCITYSENPAKRIQSELVV